MKRFALAAVLFASVAFAGPTPDRPWLPDPTVTPGVAESSLTDSVLTARGFHTKDVRPSIPTSTRKRIFAAYGIAYARHSDFELDHLIPIGIGGASTEKNLWPEPLHCALRIGTATFDVGAKTKDRLEDVLIIEVRHRDETPAAARAEISSDWIAAYRKHVGELPGFDADR